MNPIVEGRWHISVNQQKKPFTSRMAFVKSSASTPSFGVRYFHSSFFFSFKRGFVGSISLIQTLTCQASEVL